MPDIVATPVVGAILARVSQRNLVQTIGSPRQGQTLTFGGHVYVCTPMPFYRVELAPDQLRYRNGIVVLETARDGEDWLWRANSNGKSVELLRRPTLVAFARDRFEGFEVAAGSAADLIMTRLVRDGFAELTIPGKVRVRPLRSCG